MAERDVERNCTTAEFIATLRRPPAALERGAPLRVQAAGTRFTIPGVAALPIEHEANDDEEELELQLRWQR